MKRSQLILVLVINFLFIPSLLAEIRLPAIVSSDMVLQRNTTVVLWGWTNASERITIETSWEAGRLETRSDHEGNWKVEVKTTNSKEPQVISINTRSSTVMLDNILFGEVWICSGQSNMEQPMRGFNGQPTFESNMAVARSNNPNLRLFTVERKGSRTPLKDVEEYRKWQEASPDNVLDFSAVAYFFGQQLQEILDCPVGMIHTSWGGSSVQAWISNEMITNYQHVNLDDVDLAIRTNQIPTALYNAMINPLIPFTIKGALWYQGESNRSEPDKYMQLFPAMVQDWRTRWDIGDFPFYYVQIAPFYYRADSAAYETVQNSAFIREAQLQSLDRIPNSGIVITMDIGDKYSIHPPKKKEVADRLLFNALNQTYGFENVDHASPIYESMEIKDGGVTLNFKNAERGLYAYGELTGFEIAGSDKVFYPATASIVTGRNVFVISDKVPEPFAVRYGWSNWVMGTLFDTNLLPASSFRTDNWDDATRAEE
jgi:sialate O-acetylesterase